MKTLFSFPLIWQRRKLIFLKFLWQATNPHSHKCTVPNIISIMLLLNKTNSLCRFETVWRKISHYLPIPLGIEYLWSLFSPFFKYSWIPKISENRKITIPFSIHKTGNGAEADLSWFWGTSCWILWVSKEKLKLKIKKSKSWHIVEESIRITWSWWAS